MKSEFCLGIRIKVACCQEDNVIKLNKITKSYGDNIIIKELSLDVKNSEILAIIGPSGVGKTTLLNIMSGMLDITGGTKESFATRLGYVFQEDRLIPWINMKENIQFVDGKLPEDELQYLIETMGLKGSEFKYPGEMSGGMRQRAAIARAFAYKPDLLLMDEPFKSIDYYLKEKIIKALIEVWQEQTTTVVFVTHDMEEALLLADRILVIGRKPAVILKEICINSPRCVTENEALSIKKEIKKSWEEIK